jgi:hypothetical protein
MDEKKLKLAMDARLVNLAEHLIFPLLEQYIKNVTSHMVARLNAGERDFVADVAKIAAYQELFDQLRRTQYHGNKADSQIHPIK